MIAGIVTDIEGTTSSLSFVKDVLFPYSRERMASFLEQRQTDPQVRDALAEVAQIAGKPLTLPESAALLLHWIDEDRKITPLKALQGMIWKQGYARGDFKGHIYEDAARNLKKWHAAGKRLYVFSSGSVPAQQLLFAHTDFGDLTPLFSGYFDTRIGNKRESTAYSHIASAAGLPAENILFLSDIEQELDAAAATGMKTVKLVREGGRDPNTRHTQVDSFDRIDLASL